MRRRYGLTGLLVALAVVGAAAAGDLTDPVWEQAPDSADWAKVYPAHAAQAGLAGDVKLRCVAADNGALAKCIVVAETPAGEGFGAAALTLAGGMLLRITGQNGQSITGRGLLVPVRFDPAILQGAKAIGNPEWVRMPTDDETQNYWPANSGSKGGKAVLQCVVTRRGLLENCAVQTETPPSHGFGPAALALSQLFIMRPMTVDGAPVGGGKVVIPVVFYGGGSAVSKLRLLRTAPWAAAPTAAQVSNAFPHDAVGHIPSAHVVLRCAIDTDGRLARCSTMSEEPKGHGFDQAAQQLSHDFRVLVDLKVDHLDDLLVDVPFDFRDPSQPQQPAEVYDPKWLRMVSADDLAKVYPAAAAKTGVNTGLAKISCAVAHDGTLNGCSVESEDPPGLGFGAAALTIAGVLQMNPWTAQGAPVEGARISLPIRMVMPAEAPASAAPAAPTPPAAKP